MEECNKENYLLQGSLDGQSWLTLEVLPVAHATHELINRHKHFRFFVIKSDVTNEVLIEIENIHG